MNKVQLVTTICIETRRKRRARRGAANMRETSLTRGNTPVLFNDGVVCAAGHDNRLDAVRTSDLVTRIIIRPGKLGIKYLKQTTYVSVAIHLAVRSV